MHTRDNRRAFPSHFSSTPPRDRRELAWHEREDGSYEMTLDGQSVAECVPYGPFRPHLLGEWVQPYTARLLGAQGAEQQCLDLDAARLWCEAALVRRAA